MSSEIRVNTVSEGTSASGVTVDGVLIKDGLVDGKDVSTINSGGLILLSSNSPSGASAVTADTIFSSTYTNYKITYALTVSHSTSSTIRMQLRSGSSTNTNSTYTSGLRTFRINADTEFETRDDTADRWDFTGVDGSQTNNRVSVDVTLFSPNLTARTAYSGTFFTDEVANQQFGYMGGTFENTTAFDGFTIFPSAGTFSGKINIYGMVD
tara:strand:+ start:1403 stop:2032 length:630 start_codon:yes stop_codon:yes gene_type:complete